MIVTFQKQICSICKRMRNHEVYHALARCVRCNYVADAALKTAICDLDAKIN